MDAHLHTVTHPAYCMKKKALDMSPKANWCFQPNNTRLLWVYPRV